MSIVENAAYEAAADQLDASYRNHLSAFVVAAQHSLAKRDTHTVLMSCASIAAADFDHDVLADLFATAAVQLAVGTPDRYRLAWQNARQRAANHLAALVEADTERDYLRAQLRERDDQVAQLVAENADFKGLVR